MTMIRIGEFSRLARVPVPTLRFYDQMGLLRPVEVDRFTGYRYYSHEQLARLHRILALKGLGFELEQIANLLDGAVDADALRAMLMLRQTQIHKELESAQQQLREVDTWLRRMDDEGESGRHEVLLRRVEPVLVAQVREQLPNHGAVGALFGEVYKALGKYVETAIAANPGEGGNTMVIWYDGEFKETGVDGAAAFVLRHPVPSAGRMEVVELPAITVAATVHRGDYESIGEAHAAVLRWIGASDYRIAGPDREVYLYNRAPIRRDDDTYVTEIQYPVERRDAPSGASKPLP